MSVWNKLVELKLVFSCVTLGLSKGKSQFWVLLLSRFVLILIAFCLKGSKRS